MADAPRLFIVAGEVSGDRLGADLVRRMRAERAVEIMGVGGDALGGEGLASLFPMSDLSVMGYRDVVLRLPLLLRRLSQTVQAILAAKPDMVVLIDSQVFSQKVAERLRKNGYAGQIVLYVAPSVWAWKPERAALLRPLFDEVLAILPFEPAVMKRLDGPPTAYVGHPALEATSLRTEQPRRGPLLLLPGSRSSEVRKHLPIMQAVAMMLRKHDRISGFVLPTVKGVEPMVLEAVTAWQTPVYVTTAIAEKWQAYRDSVGAVAVNGTVTLELALSGVPMVATYVAERTQMRRVAQYKVKHITLPNILVGEGIVPEFLGLKVDPEQVAAEMAALLDDPDVAARQLAAFARIRAGMQKGAPEAPLENAADRVFALLDQRRSMAI